MALVRQPRRQEGVAFDEDGLRRKRAPFRVTAGRSRRTFYQVCVALLHSSDSRVACSEPSDQDLVAGALNGESASFAELATRHRARVERICQRFFSDAEQVRDLAQETFIHAYGGLKGYRAEIPFGAWLRAIATNLCYDELRRRRRRPEELVADFSAAEANWVGLIKYGYARAVGRGGRGTARGEDAGGQATGNAQAGG